ncbi:MAG: hypothetical protein FJW64_00365 [Actinobacteria bacterium]|nr:hypothetical protein [Actinomycetota bacterium]
MANGFKINPQAIRQMSKEIEREFARNPVRIPVQMDAPTPLPPAATINNYNGPVVTVNGDHAQIAWDNDTATQNGSQVIADGYEQLAAIITDLVASISTFALSPEEEGDGRDAAGAVLAELVKESPDTSIVRRGVTLLRGLLGPVAAGLNRAATEETAETARAVIQQLTESLN